MKNKTSFENKHLFTKSEVKTLLEKSYVAGYKEGHLSDPFLPNVLIKFNKWISNLK